MTEAQANIAKINLGICSWFAKLRRLSPIATIHLGSSHLWDLIEDTDGDVYGGTPIQLDPLNFFDYPYLSLPFYRTVQHCTCHISNMDWHHALRRSAHGPVAILREDENPDGSCFV